MHVLAWLARILAIATATAAFGAGASAQDSACNDISERYEDALARIDMRSTRMSIIGSLDSDALRPEIITRINTEFAALSRNEQGRLPEEVVGDYLNCRFGLNLGTDDLVELVDSPQIIVASNCSRCEATVEAANDVFDTLYSLSQHGSSLVVLRDVLDERDRQVEWLLACEQAACRDTALKHAGVTLTAADYMRALQAARDPAAWATAPVVVSELPDYAAMDKPVGQYPVVDGSVGQ